MSAAAKTSARSRPRAAGFAFIMGPEVGNALGLEAITVVEMKIAVIVVKQAVLPVVTPPALLECPPLTDKGVVPDGSH
jgi:hypothetical protein